MITTVVPTRFHLVRHAVVAPKYLTILYGQMDVAICPIRRLEDSSRYAALAAILPKPARWIITPLSRTLATAEAIMASGYGTAEMEIEPGLIEQDFGTWQGQPMSDIYQRPRQHPFWPVGGDEQPPSGESFSHMRRRVGAALDRLVTAYEGASIVAVAHGGAIRAAVAEALGLSSHQALSLAVDNLSVTRIERHAHAWRLVSLNEQISI